MNSLRNICHSIWRLQIPKKIPYRRGRDKFQPQINPIMKRNSSCDQSRWCLHWPRNDLTVLSSGRLSLFDALRTRLPPIVLFQT